jgi:WD40 repeat protein
MMTTTRAPATTPIIPVWRTGIPAHEYCQVVRLSADRILSGTSHAAGGKTVAGSLTLLDADTGAVQHQVSDEWGITWVAGNSDGTRIATSEHRTSGGVEEARVRILDGVLTELQQYHEPLGDHTIVGLVYSGDGKFVYGKSIFMAADPIVFSFDAATGAQRWRLSAAAASGLALSPDSRAIAFSRPVTGLEQVPISVCNTVDGSERLSIPLPAWTVAIEWTPDGTSLIAAANDGVLRAYDSTNGALRWSAQLPGAGGFSVSVSLDGRWVAAASQITVDGGENIGMLSVFEVSTGTARFEPVQLGWPGIVRFSPSLRHLILGSAILLPGDTGHGIAILDAHTGQELRRSDTLINDSARAVDGSFVVTTGTGYVERYDLDVAVSRYPIKAQLKTLAMSPSGTPLVAVGHTSPTDDQVTVLTAREATRLTTQPVPGGIADLVFVQGSQAIVAGGGLGVRKFGVAAGTPDWTKPASDTGGQVVALATVGGAGDGVAVGGGRSVRVLETSDGSLRWKAPDGNGLVTQAAVDQTGRWTAAGYSDRVVRVFDTGGTETFHTDPSNGLINTLEFQPSGTLFGFGTDDGLVILVDAATAGEVGRLKRLFGCSHLAFSASGLLATGWNDDDCAVSIYRSDAVASDLPLHEFRCSAPISALGFSPVGSILAATTDSATVQLFDAARGVQLAPVVHPAPVSQFAFSPDGTLISTICADKVVRVFTTPPSE